MSSISEEEILGARVAAHEPKIWRWRIEPGKEETFEYLRGWLLQWTDEGDHIEASAVERQERT